MESGGCARFLPRLRTAGRVCRIEFMKWRRRFSDLSEERWGGGAEEVESGGCATFLPWFRTAGRVCMIELVRWRRRFSGVRGGG